MLKVKAAQIYRQKVRDAVRYDVKVLTALKTVAPASKRIKKPRFSAFGSQKRCANAHHVYYAPYKVPKQQSSPGVASATTLQSHDISHPIACAPCPISCDLNPVLVNPAALREKKVRFHE